MKPLGVVACRNQIHFFKEEHWKMVLQPGGGGGLLCKAHLQLVNHRLFSYHSSGASSTYFGDRVAFVLCSVWLGASTDHSCCLVTYSSCRGKVFVMSCPLFPGLSLRHSDTPYPLSPPVQSIISDSYGEICVLFFNLWNGNCNIIINFEPGTAWSI